METHECDKGPILNIILETTRETKQELKEVRVIIESFYAIKNKVTGGVIVVSFLISAAVTLLSIFLK